MIGNQCECGSGKGYLACCGQYHQDMAVALTAEALMRSRYCAYVREYNEYLNKSWHSSTRPRDAITHNPQLIWRGLEVINIVGGGEQDSRGEVEFVAHYTISGRPESLHERSHFIREAGQWFYVRGDDLLPLVAAASDKIARNEPCPCGSGKKYKKCCGSN